MYKSQKFATIKERRAVADLLALQAGRAARGPEDITAAANMSDDEIKAYLKEHTPAPAVEDPEQKENIIYLDNNDVEEIKPGGAFDLYDVAKTTVKNYIDSMGWDPEKISPIQWGAVMMGCGRAFRSSFRTEQKNCITSNNIKQIDINAIAAAVPVWEELCSIYNKTPLICDFCSFCSISDDYLYKSGSGVTPDGVAILQKLRQIQANGLRKRAIDPRVSPVGAIFLLKADHGLVEATKVQHEYIKTDETGAALPDFGSFTALDDKNS